MKKIKINHGRKIIFSFSVFYYKFLSLTVPVLQLELHDTTVGNTSLFQLRHRTPSTV